MNLQKVLGVKAFLNMILNFIENYNQAALSQSIQLSYYQLTTIIDSLLNIIHSNALKIKIHDDIESGQIV